MTPAWPILVAVLAASAPGSRASRPTHVLTSAHDAVPLLRRWAPTAQGTALARHVGSRATSVAGGHPQAVAAVVDAVAEAFVVAARSDRAAGSACGPPEHPFRVLQGTLPGPVLGAPRSRFGPRLRPDLATTERHSGWGWPVVGELTVRSVAEGIVAGVLELPGLGLVVVIDHGDQYHTVYAGLSESWTYEGSRLRAGDIVGVAAGAFGGMGEFYFEIRDQGVPVDPGQWLR